MLSALVASFLIMPQPTLPRGEWLTDWDKAQRFAAASGKTIVANFTGSDWCPFCLRLKEEVFDTDVFLDWADDNAVLFVADFPREKKLPPAEVKQNDLLTREYSVGGYPSVLFINGRGEHLGRTGYLQTTGARYWTKVADKLILDGKNQIKRSDGFPALAAKQIMAKDLRGKPFPEFELGDVVTGKLPDDLKGKTILLDFWATWCSPCVEEMPRLDAWAKEFGDDLVVIGLTDEPADKVKRFASRHKISYPLVTDSKQTLAIELNIQTLPQMMLISNDGIVRWQGTIGDGDPLTTAKLRRMIEATK